MNEKANTQMSEKELIETTTKIAPWIVSVGIAVFGALAAIFRNEYTTRQMKKSIYTKDTGDLRLVKTEDCQTCRQECRNDIIQKLQDEATVRQNERTELRNDIIRIHEKLDDLPERIMTRMGRSSV